MLGQKVSITSPKAQTTRSQIEAVLENERGQIFFMDNPGFYSSKGVSAYNQMVLDSLKDADVILYLVDHTREWGEEEDRLWGYVELMDKPVIVTINKIDVVRPSYRELYIDRMKEKTQDIIEVSALKEKNLKELVNILFEKIPAGERDKTVDYFSTPLLSQTGPEFVGEIIREKVFIYTNQEVPYQTRVRNVEIEEVDDKLIKVRAEIEVNNKRYKPILIGKNGQKISEISKAVQKEISVASNKTAQVRLQVVVARD
jgi:GTP-binding protein Era